MRRLVITDEAARQLNNQIDYLLDRDASMAARELCRRVSGFVANTLTTYPASSKYIAERDLWESWIPGTKLIVWYRFDPELLTVISFCHTSQDREAGP